MEQNAFAGCQIQRIVLPDSLESITPTTFSQCDHVKEIVWNGTKKFDGYSYLPAIEEGTSDGDYNELESYEYEKGEDVYKRQHLHFVQLKMINIMKN